MHICSAEGLSLQSDSLAVMDIEALHGQGKRRDGEGGGGGWGEGRGMRGYRPSHILFQYLSAGGLGRLQSTWSGLYSGLSLKRSQMGHQEHSFPYEALRKAFEGLRQPPRFLFGWRMCGLLRDKCLMEAMVPCRAGQPAEQPNRGGDRCPDQATAAAGQSCLPLSCTMPTILVLDTDSWHPFAKNT